MLYISFTFLTVACASTHFTAVFQRAELVYITVCHGYVAGEYLSPEKGKFRIVGNTEDPDSD